MSLLPPSAVSVVCTYYYLFIATDRASEPIIVPHARSFGSGRISATIVQSAAAITREMRARCPDERAKVILPTVAAAVQSDAAAAAERTN